MSLITTSWADALEKIPHRSMVIRKKCFLIVVIILNVNNNYLFLLSVCKVTNKSERWEVKGKKYLFTSETLLNVRILVNVFMHHLSISYFLIRKGGYFLIRKVGAFLLGKVSAFLLGKVRPGLLSKFFAFSSALLILFPMMEASLYTTSLGSE